MATVSVSELTGKALDWAVAKVMVAVGDFTEDAYEFGTGRPYFNVKGSPCLWGCGEQKANWLDPETGNPQVHHGPGGTYSPSNCWAQGGPLLGTVVNWFEQYDDDNCGAGCADTIQYGPTPLVAICRAIVAANLGNNVEIPEELKP